MFSFCASAAIDPTSKCYKYTFRSRYLPETLTALVFDALWSSPFHLSVCHYARLSVGVMRLGWLSSFPVAGAELNAVSRGSIFILQPYMSEMRQTPWVSLRPQSGFLFCYCRHSPVGILRPAPSKVCLLKARFSFRPLIIVAGSAPGNHQLTRSIIYIFYIYTNMK